MSVDFGLIWIKFPKRTIIIDFSLWCLSQRRILDENSRWSSAKLKSCRIVGKFSSSSNYSHHVYLKKGLWCFEDEINVVMNYLHIPFPNADWEVIDLIQNEVVLGCLPKFHCQNNDYRRWYKYISLNEDIFSNFTWKNVGSESELGEEACASSISFQQ